MRSAVTIGVMDNHAHEHTPGIVVGVDAHKRTHTMVGVDAAGRRLGSKTVAATTQGHYTALRWVHDTFGPDVRWGVEDTRAMTGRLERDLMDAGQQVVRVPTQLMSRTRNSGREWGKSDPIDALAVARAVLAYPDLPVARHSRWSREIKLLLDRRDDLVKHRTAMSNRLLWRVHELDPTHALAPRSLVWRKNQDALAAWLAPQTGIVAEIARAELDDITGVTPQINALERRVAQSVRAAAPALLELYGCGDLTAARILGEVADVRRFKSEAAFARYAGVAPVPHWSGSTRGRLRSHKGGNRALNAALHQIVLVRITSSGPDAERYRHRTDVESQSHASAMRRLKRRLARIVYRRLRADSAGTAFRNDLAEMDRRAREWSLHLPDPPPRKRQRRAAPMRTHASQLPFAPDALMADLTSRGDEWAHILAGVSSPQRSSDPASSRRWS